MDKNVLCISNYIFYAYFYIYFIYSLLYFGPILKGENEKPY